jgi:1,4-dihydroxy-2-naphthoate octaprenyltransferase
MEDSISWAGFPSKFAGGAGVFPRRMLGREALFYGSLVSAGLAILSGLVIWIGFETGPWTIPFGLIGILGGFFYSSPPFRWVATGFGEIWILVCYGFLTVAVGLYLPFGQLTLLSTLVSVPIAATIFNVIFANEYPDYESDRAAHKTNLLSRVGRSRGAWIYVIFSIAGNISFVISMFAGVPMLALACYTLPFIISVYCVLGFIRGDWRNRDKLEMICGLTILVNLTTTLSYLMAFALG